MTAPKTLRVALLVSVAIAAACATDRRANSPFGTGEDWPSYLGDKGTTHYSTLNRIMLRSSLGWLRGTAVQRNL